MKNNYVAIMESGISFRCLQITYTSDGGFFIMPIGLGDEGYLVDIVKIPKTGFGSKKVPWDEKKMWQTKIKPKLMHHSDGTAHISGTGIYSGKYKFNKKHKGVHMESVNLFLNNNDGGPIFTFLIWGLDLITQRRERSGNLITIKESDITDDSHQDRDGKLAYCIEGFYLDKRVTQYLNFTNGNMPFLHPNYGIIPLKYVPNNENTPGVMGLFCRKTKAGFDSEYGISMGGAPGPTLSDNTWEQINILYPLSVFTKKGYSFRSIEYKGVYKIYTFFDNLIGKVKNYLSPTAWSMEWLNGRRKT